MIQFVKLVTGDEFIADIKTDGSKTQISHASQLQVDRESKSIQFVPYGPICETTPFCVANEHIVFTRDIFEEIQNGFRGVWGGLVIEPPKKLVI